MNSTFEDRLVVFVAPLVCCALAIGWTLTRGDQNAGEDIGLVAEAPGAKVAGAGTVATAPTPAAITPVSMPRDDALTEPSADSQSSEMQALDSTVGDYSKPDPMPAEMLRGSYQAASLGLVDAQDRPLSDVRLSATGGRVAGEVQ